MTRRLGRVLAAALPVVLVLGTVSPASAAKRKPPKITDVSASSRLANQGSAFQFTVSAQNTSKKASRSLPLVFVLSESSDPDDGVSLGSGSIPGLGRKARTALPFSVTIPSAQEDDDYRLLVCTPKARKLKCQENVAVDVEEVTAGSSGSSGGAGAPPPGTNGALPSSILNLTNWKLTLPVDSSGGTSGTAAEIRQPTLGSYRHPTWFVANAAGNGVMFRAHANGATTSENTDYARSELREMTSGGASNASWSPNSGTHTMILTQSITRLPGSSKPEVVAGQIHDGSDDVLQVRLEGRRLFLSLDDGQDEVDLTTNYTLGAGFALVITSTPNGITVTYNGVTKVSNFKPSDAGSAWYFKAGCYTQSNESGTYGEVIVYDLRISHS